ncbi:fumarylacetoacetate hydrolase family protein [Roseomonas sp. GC11]|uniref:2-keto-4-pentenoate hydratase n=1 Tax=Roseomonas sp. GC11 TaxID=2950546 RepID=UPI00210AABF2|nr:fumarylacetoacetate hydrolase family protein [Roseomonas sp. GC11]MCQ4162628.1 fumarylacetoacetate hydrolase family protein [Roseomonas sp. GC11]
MATDYAAAAHALLEARRTRQWLSALPEGARPQTPEEVVEIQALVAAQLGPIAGWKVGAPSPEGTPSGVPLHERDLRFDATPYAASDFNVTAIEAEVGYRLGADLPPRATPYTREEVLAAVATLHPTIEVVDTRFTALGVSEPLSHTADQANHGALVVGPAVADWHGIEPPKLPVTLSFNGKVAVQHVGGNAAGDPVRLLLWLANGGAHRYGGLKAGMVITTGSCTGLLHVPAGTAVKAVFEGFGTVETTIA